MPKEKYCQIAVYVNGILIDSVFDEMELKYHPKHFQRIKEILDMPDDGTGFVTPNNLERKS